MPDEQKPEINLEPSPPELPAAPLRRAKRKRSFKIDKQKIVDYILESHQKACDDRQERIDKRTERRAKLMGWLPEKDWPWVDCANFSVPIMQIANLKTRAALENAIKSVRPVMQSKALQRRNIAKQSAIDRTLDFQFFIENAGEKLIDELCGNFVEDEAVFGFVQWVKETQIIHDVRVLDGLDPTIDHIPQLLIALETIYSKHLSEAMKDEEGWIWEVVFQDDYEEQRIARVEFWETDDDKLEAHLAFKATTHDGPVIHVEDFEDIVFPVRSANLQSPSASNPRGAPWVDRVFITNRDTIRRRMDDKTYDVVTKEDWQDKIKGSKSDAGSGDQKDEVESEKDKQQGTRVTSADDREDLTGIMRFGRFDVNGDGLEEDVICWVLKDSKVLLKIALLTEIYPGIPIKRPFAHDAFIPISNRIYGISQSELLEQIQDMVQTLFDQHIDWGTITNTPMGFYRAASGLKPEQIAIEPGILHPLDNVTDVVFPTWPTKDSGFALNTIAVLQQFAQDIRGFSDMAVSGRVPTGKASALRTLGTTMSLLAQSDVRAEQVLRRLFSVLSGIYGMMHRLNRRFLPAEKEIRVIGMSAESEGAYITTGRDDVDADIDFEFKATLLNTNKQILSQSFEKSMAVLISPLAFQAGLITLDEIYNLVHDYEQSLDHDPDRYVKRPPNPMPGPKLLAEEVISMILRNEMPKGSPLETPQEHLQKLAAYMQSDEFGLMNQTQAVVLRDWMAMVQSVINQQMMMQQALASFQQQTGGQNGEGPGGVLSTLNQSIGTAENPPVNANELVDESVNMGNGGAQ